MTNLAVAVTHASWAEDLTRHLVVERQREEVPGLLVVHDRHRTGAWDVTRDAYRGLLVRFPEATHHLVLQDDMQPCKGFLGLARGAVEARPDHPICLFTMRKITREAYERGDSWAVSNEGGWGGSVIHPASWTEPYLTWDRGHVDPSYSSSDRRLMWWTHEVEGHREVWHTAPSLLQHVGAGASLMGHSNRTRVASVYDEDPGPIDWTVPDEPLRQSRSLQWDMPLL